MSSGGGCATSRRAIEDLTPLSDGHRLAFDGFDLDVLHLPGHTAGHICMYHGESGILFSGDTLILHITPNPLIEPDPADPMERRRSLIEYVRSLDALGRMELSTVYRATGSPSPSRGR